MAEDLIEIHERISFAKEEIHDLAAAERKFTADAITVRTEQYPGGVFEAKAKQTKPIPTALPAKAGMIANELRACLDSLACRLAVRNGRSASSVYFPISKSKEVFETGGMEKIKKLSPTDQATIAGLTPYREGNRLLFGLHEADRTRKHQRLVACASQSGGLTIAGVNLISGSGSATITLQDGTFNGVKVPFLVHKMGGAADRIMNVGQEIVLASGTGSAPPLGFNMRLAYAEPEELAGRPVVETLIEFADTVTTIVAKFG